MEIVNIAMVLKQNELLFAQLYQECVRLFPDFKNEFEMLVAEEEGHAAIIDNIIKEITDKPENWRPGKVSLRTITVIQEQIQATLAEVKSDQCAPRYVITALRSYEQSMSERAVEKVLDTDVPEFKLQLCLVAEGFTNHLNCLQELEKKIFKTSDMFDSLKS